jgi:hypothetical protein
MQADAYWHLHRSDCKNTPDLRAHDLAHSPGLWHQPRLANLTCSWRWRLCGITPAIKAAPLHAKQAQMGGRNIALHIIDLGARRSGSGPHPALRNGYREGYWHLYGSDINNALIVSFIFIMFCMMAKVQEQVWRNCLVPNFGTPRKEKKLEWDCVTINMNLGEIGSESVKKVQQLKINLVSELVRWQWMLRMIVEVAL